MTEASDLMAACLKHDGVGSVVGLPGDEHGELLDSLSRRARIRLILTRRGQAAGSAPGPGAYRAQARAQRVS